MNMEQYGSNKKENIIDHSQYNNNIVNVDKYNSTKRNVQSNNNNLIGRNYNHHFNNHINNHSVNTNDKMSQSCPIIYCNNNGNDSQYIGYDKEIQTKLQNLDNSINHLNAQNESLSKCMESLKNNNQNNYINQSHETNAFIYEVQRLKGEQTSLLNDNIVYREDINRLSNINQHLEMELHAQRQRNHELAIENDKLQKENLNYRFQIEKANSFMNQLKVNQTQQNSFVNDKHIFETKMKDTDYELKDIKNKFSELQIQYNLLHNNYDKLLIQKENSENDLKALSKVQSSQMKEIEIKVNSMLKEIDLIKKENDFLRMEVEKYRNINNINEKGRDEFKDKYHEQKCRNDLLEKKIQEIVKEFEKYKDDIHENELKRIKEEELKKEKIEAKKSLVSELQKKVYDYKNSRLKMQNNEVNFDK